MGRVLLAPVPTLSTSSLARRVVSTGRLGLGCGLAGLALRGCDQGGLLLHPADHVRKARSPSSSRGHGVTTTSRTAFVQSFWLGEISLPYSGS